MADQETATSTNGEEHKELEETGEEAEEYSERDIEAMKQRVKDMEAEAQKLREMQAEVEREQSALSGGLTEEEKEAVDARSVHVGNVDWGATPEEIQAHFQSCGTINRVTILCDKFTGHPKGFAYVEFAQPTAVADALVLNESLFRGRQIRVTPKRTNVPGMARGRGRGGRGYRGGAPSYRGYSPYGGRPRGRGRGGYRGGY